MAETANVTPYSYRDDPAVPPFPDDRPLFIFDGVCVLCSGGAAWLMRHDKRHRFQLTPAQSPLGAALYAHYGIDWNETYLLVSAGRPYAKSSGYLQMCRVVGGWWRLVLVLGLIPRPLRDWGYDLVARNRYRWFGKAEYCQLIPEDMRVTLLDPPDGAADTQRPAAA